MRRAAGRPTSHIPSADTCDTCHSTTAWRPASFDHDGRYFPIYSGKHLGAFMKDAFAEDVLREDPDLLMYYDSALLRKK